MRQLILLFLSVFALPCSALSSLRAGQGVMAGEVTATFTERCMERTYSRYQPYRNLPEYEHQKVAQ